MCCVCRDTPDSKPLSTLWTTHKLELINGKVIPKAIYRYVPRMMRVMWKWYTDVYTTPVAPVAQRYLVTLRHVGNVSSIPANGIFLTKKLQNENKNAQRVEND